MYTYYVFLDPNKMIGIARDFSKLFLTDDVSKLMKYKYQSSAIEVLNNFIAQKQLLIKVKALKEDIDFLKFQVVQMKLPINYYCFDIDKKIGGEQ